LVLPPAAAAAGISRPNSSMGMMAFDFIGILTMKTLLLE
jgi:hypothetical protein